MQSDRQFLRPAIAARRLGVSAKALRLYEERGLIAPGRTAAGWRTYGPDDMTRAGKIVALRGLGFSLTQIARVLDGDNDRLEDAFAAQQAILEDRLRQTADQLETLRGWRNGLASGQARGDDPVVAFDLPWPWGGERFALSEIRPLTYIVGPLFSGKTRLAQRLARELPNAAFLGLDRLEEGAAATRARLAADAALKERSERSLAWLVEQGATPSDALATLIVELEADGPQYLIIDMIEQGLDEATQRAVIAHLRRSASARRPLFLLTRSCAILDLDSLGADEAILFCPANHSPPISVAPHPGAPGYEAVATCLAPPEVRARSAGVVAARRPAA